MNLYSLSFNEYVLHKWKLFEESIQFYYVILFVLSAIYYPLVTTQATARPTGRQSPASAFDRADSVPSLNNVTFNTTSMPIGSSRGPSPLTIGMSDTIPLAVAFSETCNAYLKAEGEAYVT